MHHVSDVLERIIQFSKQKTKNKVRLFFLHLEIANVYPSSVSKNLAKYLIQIKYAEMRQLEWKKVEYGHLSIGGGHHDYKHVLTHAYETFQGIKRGKICVDYQIINNKLCNSIYEFASMRNL